MRIAATYRPIRYLREKTDSDDGAEGKPPLLVLCLHQADDAPGAAQPRERLQHIGGEKRSVCQQSAGSERGEACQGLRKPAASQGPGKLRCKGNCHGHHDRWEQREHEVRSAGNVPHESGQQGDERRLVNVSPRRPLAAHDEVQRVPEEPIAAACRKVDGQGCQPQDDGRAEERPPRKTVVLKLGQILGTHNKVEHQKRQIRPRMRKECTQPCSTPNRKTEVKVLLDQSKHGLDVVLTLGSTSLCRPSARRSFETFSWQNASPVVRRGAGQPGAPTERRGHRGLGPNDAGKTTTLKMLSGSSTPQRGAVFVSSGGQFTTSPDRYDRASENRISTPPNSSIFEFETSR